MNFDMPAYSFTKYMTYGIVFFITYFALETLSVGFAYAIVIAFIAAYFVHGWLNIGEEQLTESWQLSGLRSVNTARRSIAFLVHCFSWPTARNRRSELRHILAVDDANNNSSNKIPNALLFNMVWVELLLCILLAFPVSFLLTFLVQIGIVDLERTRPLSGQEYIWIMLCFGVPLWLGLGLWLRTGIRALETSWNLTSLDVVRTSRKAIPFLLLAGFWPITRRGNYRLRTILTNDHRSPPDKP